MIEINLLPEQLRKPEGTPLPRILTTYIGVAVICTLGMINFHYWSNKVPAKERELAEIKQQVQEEEARAAELDTIEAEIAQIRELVDTIKGLYRDRIIWSKILWDLKQIMNADEKLNKINPETKYAWFTDLKLVAAGRGETGADRYLVLRGLASAKDSSTGANIVRDVLEKMRTYATVAPPEKSEIRRIDLLIKQEEKARAEQTEELGETAPKSERLIELEKRRDELQLRQSGLIALKPFHQFFIEGTIGFESISWEELREADSIRQKMESGRDTDEIHIGDLRFLPRYAQKFTLRLGLKPPGGDQTQAAGRGVGGWGR